MEPWHESLSDTMDVLTGKTKKLHSYPSWEKDDLKDEGNPYVPYNVTEPSRHVIYPGKGDSTGNAVGDGLERGRDRTLYRK